MANELKITSPVVIGSLTSDPGTAFAGQMYFNTTSNKFRIYNGTSWKDANGDAITALTGDVTASGSGSDTATIASNAVSNSKLAQMAAFTVKGNNTSSTANASDLNLVAPISSQAISASAIDWSTGNMFTKTLGANTTFTFSNQTSGQTIVVRLTNTASNFTVTWPTVRWAGGTAPTMTTGAVSDVYTFIYDGSNTYGSAVQNMS